MSFLKKYFFILLMILLGASGFLYPHVITAGVVFVANEAGASNFHIVVPGKFYRSSQMSRKKMRDLIRDYGIRTVIDFRLDNDLPDSHGLRESQVAKQEGATYVHIPFSSTKLPKKSQLEHLVSVYDSATLPILVHCSSGVHRTGISTFIWLMTNENVPLNVALAQISPMYGFFRIERKYQSLVKGRNTMDKIVWDFIQSHKEKSISFRKWLSLSDTDLEAPQG